MSKTLNKVGLHEKLLQHRHMVNVYTKLAEEEKRLAAEEEERLAAAASKEVFEPNFNRPVPRQFTNL